MNLRERVENLRDEARSLISDSEQKIDPLKLSAELQWILDQTDKSNEHLWRKYNRRMELWKETRLEMTRAVISFGQVAIRSLILINGGAAVAVMTFIGNFKGQSSQIYEYMACALLLFSLGVVAAATIAGFAYATQYLYDISSGRLSKYGIAFHLAAVILAMVSVGLFTAGILQAYNGFLISG